MLAIAPFAFLFFVVAHDFMAKGLTLVVWPVRLELVAVGDVIMLTAYSIGTPCSLLAPPLCLLIDRRESNVDSIKLATSSRSM